MTEKIGTAESEDAAKPYKPSPHELAAVAEFFAKDKQAPRAPRMKVSEKEIAFDHPEPAVAQILLMKALGTGDFEFLHGILDQLENATAGDTVNERELNFMLAVVKGVEPRDQVEAMLAAQMAVVHIATMAFARRLARGECPLDTEGPERAFPKLARTFAAQVEALKRYRGKGERKAMGEGVELKAGGRGVVGAPPAADNSSKANGHSHERATHAPQPAMRSPNSERSTVPVTSDAERPLPHARRDVARSAERK
jgi:hypothetical protein